MGIQEKKGESKPIIQASIIKKFMIICILYPVQESAWVL